MVSGGRFPIRATISSGGTVASVWQSITLSDLSAACRRATLLLGKKTLHGSFQ